MLLFTRLKRNCANGLQSLVMMVFRGATLVGFLITVQSVFDAFPHDLDEEFENVFTEIRILPLQMKEGAFLFVGAAGYPGTRSWDVQ